MSTLVNALSPPSSSTLTVRKSFPRKVLALSVLASYVELYFNGSVTIVIVSPTSSNAPSTEVPVTDAAEEGRGVFKSSK